MDSKAEIVHPTGDEVLSILANLPGALGNFILSYPGNQSEDASWLGAEQSSAKHETYCCT